MERFRVRRGRDIVDIPGVDQLELGHIRDHPQCIVETDIVQVDAERHFLLLDIAARVEGDAGARLPPEFGKDLRQRLPLGGDATMDLFVAGRIVCGWEVVRARA